MSSNTSRNSLTKRACDSCRIRKIKCGGQQPCKACVVSKLECTFLQQALARGAPQRLRRKTRQAIEKIQQSRDSTCSSSNTPDVSDRPSWSGRPGLEPRDAPVREPQSPGSPPIKTLCMSSDVLALQLYNYRSRLYPVWPVVNVEETLAAIQGIGTPVNLESYALATAVSAATMAQLRLPPSTYNGKTVTSDIMATECLRILQRVNYQQNLSLTSIRIAFFLHVYHENKDRGGNKSWLYLREAISMAQILRLGSESSYNGLTFEEEQLGRRIYWLLYVTERGVSILHKLPVTLSAVIARPKAEGTSDATILPAFLSLVDLFFDLDQTGLYNLMPDMATNQASNTLYDRDALRLLLWKLNLSPSTTQPISDVQKADIYVTRLWVQAILWKLSGPQLQDSAASLLSPLEFTKNFLSAISKLPHSAFESHGIGMELKINEIANTVIGADNDSAIGSPSVPNMLSQNVDVLLGLCKVLTSFGGSREVRQIIAHATNQQSLGPFNHIPQANLNFGEVENSKFENTSQINKTEKVQGGPDFYSMLSDSRFLEPPDFPSFPTSPTDLYQVADGFSEFQSQDQSEDQQIPASLNSADMMYNLLLFNYPQIVEPPLTEAITQNSNSFSSSPIADFNQHSKFSNSSNYNGDSQYFQGVEKIPTSTSWAIGS